VSTTASSLVGKSISHYRILRQLGAGGMGVVYEAEDSKLGRRVAVKFLSDELQQDAPALERFRREARAASALNHPGICTVHAIEQHEGRSFIVMELLEGETLAQRMGRQALTVSVVLEFGIQIADALEAAHSKGIVHRDLKPVNLVVTPRSQIKILDFGLAKMERAPPASDETLSESAAARYTGTDLTVAGTVLGTVHYMSPEQAKGEPTDERTDLFSLGAVLYQMASGSLPFQGNTQAVVFEAILNREPKPLSEVAPAMPEALGQIIDKALEKDRELRYQTAAELRADLRRLERDSSATAAAGSTSGDSDARGSARVFGLRRRTVGGAAATLALIVAGVFFYASRMPALSEKDTIVVAELANETGDTALDTVLRQALLVTLGESPYLNLVSDHQIAETLRLMGLSADAPLTPDVAREICIRRGGTALLEGSVAPLGTRLVVTLNALHCQDGKALGRGQAMASGVEGVLDALASAAASLRRGLGESLRSVARFNTPLEDATTSSLEALQAYAAGVERFHRVGDLEALPFLRRAVELDPNFALAYRRLAISYANLGEYTAGARHARRAYELRDRLSAREKLVVEAAYFSLVTGESYRTIETYKLWRQSYPRDSIPWNNAANEYLELGECDQAYTEAAENLRLHPNLWTAHLLAIASSACVGRFDEVKTRFETALREGHDFAKIRWWRQALALKEGDEALVRQQLEWAATHREGTILQLLQGNFELSRGRLRGARALLREAVQQLEAWGGVEAARWAFEGHAVDEALLGECAMAREPAVRSRDEEPRVERALAFALCGDPDRAEALRQAIAAERPADTLVQAVDLPAILAAIHLQHGRPEAAVDALVPALGHRRALGRGAATYLRGIALLRAGRPEEAVRELARLVESGYASFTQLAASELALARAYAQAGDTARSRQTYQILLDRWREAEPDFVPAQQARREHAALAAVAQIH
jgi:eukaryotic-like serine/threonine-protein kinase